MSLAPRQSSVPQIERTRETPGRVVLHAEPDHRLKMHASAPSIGACKAHRIVYTRGDIDVLPAGMSAEWDEAAESAAVLVRLPDAMLRAAADDLGLDPDRVGIDARWQLRDPRIEHLVWALDAERSHGSPSGRLYAQSLGTALAVHLLGHYRRSVLPTRGLSRPQLRRVTEYIDTHLDRTLGLDDLADVAGLGPTQFKLRFRVSVGTSVHAYVVAQRVERAKRLLQAGAQSITQVALESGFAHGSHLARCMRRALGVSPRELLRA